MIHIITHHFATTAWLEIQKRHILKHTNPEQTPYKLYLAKYNLEIPDDFELPDNWELIDLDILYPKDGKNEHYLQMEWLYQNCIKDKAQDNDIIIFLDSDAFPCDERWLESISIGLLGHEYKNISPEYKVPSDYEPACAVVIHFTENRGIAQPDHYYPYPDLCFFATTKKVWEDNNLEWYIDYSNPEHQNPGFGMKDKIMEANLGNVAAITRTNKFNAHNVMFGVYGGILYHQHCGSRAIIGRPMETAGADIDKSRHCYTGFDLHGRRHIGNWFIQDFQEECEDIVETNTEIFDIIYNRLHNDYDCTFIRRYFLGMP
jgi:hypothetical protein